MNLEPVKQSEVSQKEKNNYYILTHIYEIYIYGIYKNSYIYETHIYVYMESRKMALMNLFAGKEWRRRCRERTWGHCKGKRERDERRTQH